MTIRFFALPLATLAATLTLAGCATARDAAASTPVPDATDGIARAAIGQRVYVDGPAVTPLEVLEDSRCPKGVMCVWAGQVRLKVQVHLGSRDEIHELTLGKPVHVADGNIELVEVTPDRIGKAVTTPQPYRFGFRFMGGL